MSKFELKPFHNNIPNEELIDDIKTVASLLNKTPTGDEYSQHGKFSLSVIEKRFGWNNALSLAGLPLLILRGLSENELFENLEEVWINLGRQPV